MMWCLSSLHKTIVTKFCSIAPIHGYCILHRSWPICEILLTGTNELMSHVRLCLLKKGHLWPALLLRHVCVCVCVCLAGPPGTGKTSLCKALAQKLSVVLQERYQYTQLVEINSHSLFSKWFSEVQSRLLWWWWYQSQLVMTMISISHCWWCWWYQSVTAGADDDIT